MSTDDDLTSPADRAEHGPEGDRDAAMRAARREAELNNLAAQAADGNKEALNRLLKLIRTPVVRYCRGKMGEGIGLLTAEDVAQDVLFAVCGALHRFRPGETAAMPFVYGIARNKVVDAFRSHGRDKSEPTDSIPDAPVFDKEEDSQFEDLLLRAAGLNDYEADAIQSVIDGTSTRDQAALNGRKWAAVRKDRERARRKIQNYFGLTDAEKLALQRDSFGDELAAARAKIRTAMENARVTRLPAVQSPPAVPTSKIWNLSPDELETAQMAAAGSSNSTIGSTLQVSGKTVEARLSSVYRKLGVHSRAGLARLLHTQGVVGVLPDQSAMSKESNSHLITLARKAVQGEHTSREAFLNSIQPFVMGYCFARLGARIGEDESLTLGVEILSEVFRGLPHYVDDTEPIARHVYQKARSKVDIWLTKTPPTHSFEMNINSLLEELPAAQQEILILRIGTRLSAEEVAHLVDSTPGAVRVTQHRALQKMRQRVADLSTPTAHLDDPPR